MRVTVSKVCNFVSKSSVIAIAALSFSTLSTAALGKTERLGGVYRISYAGFTVGKGSFSLILRDNAYSAKVGMEPAGIGTLFSTGKGGAQATGWMKGAKILPSTYTMASRASNRDFYVNLGQGSGHVRTTQVTPKYKPSKTRVKVTGKHKLNAMDPLSAAIVRAPSISKVLDPSVCDRELPIYDGWARFDIKMKFKEVREVSGNGYNGPVVVCTARWKPIAGHRPERKSVQYLANNAEIETWLAPIGNTRILFPYKVSIPTSTGTLVLEAAELDMPHSAKPRKKTASR
ncbi:DUF3108 domain-containing protein [Pseudovibrio sp. Tun.PSC04-5.I4]|uniref:DUF3108 domain-containing protein n=1 Tax=Pseudovibrio sp. Tun.PSC04-5.I4 TaxID=1798213 RepID=UPI00089039CD|nr:DUF3108 domain-containing protein [Pseudovibrio sp. Tun.PSC04-5.I4]SDR28775.1 Protein of unknown function [Pseudovibrio sp. Tun.PSC04-5.I4]